MRTLLLLVCLVAAGAGPLWAQKSGDVGLGVVLGDPTGVTAKFWQNGGRAIDLGVGFNNNVTVYGDYLWHSYTVFRQPSSGRLPAYLGVGAQLGNSSRNNSSLGLRGVAGLAYWLPRDPLEIFLELVPVLHFSQGGTELNAGLGLRYYFK